MPTESPSIPSKPTAVSATVTPSLDPTNNNVVVVVKEQQQADNGNQPRLPSTATPSPAVVVKEDDTSEEFEAMVTIEIAGISSLLDPSSSLVVENEVVQLLSEEIQEIEGVPVFFLKSKVESQSMFAVDDSGKNDVAIMDLRIHAISVGRGAVDEDLFRERVKLVLQEEKSKDLQKRIRAALLLFSSRGESGGNKDSQAVDITQLQDSGGGGSDINSVILVAIVVFVLIALCVLTIGVVFFVRRNRQKKGIDTHASHDSDHRLDIEKTSSGQSGGSDVDQSVLGSVIIAETKHFNRKGRPKSPSDIESNCSHSSMLSQSNYSESVYTSSPPQISAAPYDETLENIELVEVDEEGPSNVAQIAAITGGRGDTVQTVSKGCTSNTSSFFDFLEFPSVARSATSNSCQTPVPHLSSALQYRLKCFASMVVTTKLKHKTRTKLNHKNASHRSGEDLRNWRRPFLPQIAYWAAPSGAPWEAPLY